MGIFDYVRKFLILTIRRQQFLEHLFGQILVKKFFGHMTPLGPPDPSKKGVIFQK